jgi:tetratricopeptide (TPR) repeat protein
VRGVLETKRALLVLDNAQHNDQLEPFQMGGGARCAVLVTTRRDDLAALRHAQRVGLPLLSEDEALDLLRGIAGRERVEAEPEVAEEILAMVGYLPLAVDIVASRLRERPEWSLSEMRRRLADSKRRLEELEIGEDYGVRLSFDMSYHLLEPEAQRFFARMGVFGGVDFDVAAAATVAQVEGREAERILERLRHLALAQPGRRAGRYTLHPLLRDYACAHLDHQDAHQRMAAHYLAVAREAGDKLKGKEIEDGLAVLDEEISNIRAGWEWASKGESKNECEVTRGYAYTLARYFDLRAYWEDEVRWPERAIEACQKLGDERGVAAMHQIIGLVYEIKAEWDKAIEHDLKAIEGYEKMGDIHGMAGTYNNLGLVYAEKGEWERTIEFYQKALETMEKVGDIHGLAQTYNNLGIVYRQKGEWEQAIEFYQKALETLEKVGDIHGLAQTWGNLGLVYADKGEWERAIEFYQKSLETKERVGDVHGMAATWANLGFLYEAQKEYERALGYLERSLEVLKKIGSYQAAQVEEGARRVRGKVGESTTDGEN